jgi:hypothetical protein
MFVIPVMQGHAQATLPDSITYQAGIHQALEKYKSTLGPDLRLFSGNEFIPQQTGGQKAEGIPYFLNELGIRSRLAYDGNVYDSVLLLYDLVDDRLILRNETAGRFLVLHNSKVQSFTMDGHIFFNRHWGDTVLTTTNEQKVFFERLYAGKSIVWLARDKKFFSSMHAEDRTGIYREYDQYYIQTGGTLSQVDSKAALLHLLEDQRTAIRRFSSQNHLNFRKDFVHAIVSIMSFYDQLKK